MKSFEKYENIYNESILNSDLFWSQKANRLHWFKQWDKVSDVDFEQAKINWFQGGELNASYNCIDRHIENGDGDRCAIIWQGNSENDTQKYSYNELLVQVSKFANALKNNNVKKGDRVCIYMQMIPELAIAMLACARIGAVHSIVFGAFSSDSLADRINDSSCKILITQDTGVRGNKFDIPMKYNADIAVDKCSSIEKIIVVKRTGQEINMLPGRDLWWHTIMEKSSSVCKPEIMDAEDPLFILYTSGSTGKPKGVLHTTGGYLLYASYTHEVIFDYKKGDIY